MEQVRNRRWWGRKLDPRERAWIRLTDWFFSRKIISLRNISYLVWEGAGTPWGRSPFFFSFFKQAGRWDKHTFCFHIWNWHLFIYRHHSKSVAETVQNDPLLGTGARWRHTPLRSALAAWLAAEACFHLLPIETQPQGLTRGNRKRLLGEGESV